MIMHINKKQKLNVLRNSNKIPVAPLQYYNNIGCIYYFFTSVPQLPWSKPTLSRLNALNLGQRRSV